MIQVSLVEVATLLPCPVQTAVCLQRSIDQPMRRLHLPQVHDNFEVLVDIRQVKKFLLLILLMLLFFVFVFLSFAFGLSCNSICS